MSVLLSFVDRKLKSKWVRDFLLRYKIMKETHEKPEKVERTPYFAATMKLKVATDRAEVIAERKRIHKPHHLYLIPFS